MSEPLQKYWCLRSQCFADDRHVDVCWPDGWVNVYLAADVDVLLGEREKEGRIVDALMLEGSQKIDELRAQLDQAQREVARLNTIVDPLGLAAIKLEDKCADLKDQLTASQARVKELEEALSQVEVRSRKGVTLGAHDIPFIHAIVQQALTPTDRPVSEPKEEP